MSKKKRHFAVGSDAYGKTHIYDARRPTHPHSSNPNAYQEGAIEIGVRKLPRRNDPCPCGMPKNDVSYIAMENGRPTVKMKAVPELYRFCCEGINRETSSELERLQEEANEITESVHREDD